MTSRSLPRGGGGPPPDRYRKRSPDHLSQDETFSKRKRIMTKDLGDHDEIHQLVLQAAAKILGVSVQQLLSMRDSYSASSGDASSGDQDSSSNDSRDNCTPSPSSGSEKHANVTRSRLSRRPKPQSTSIGDFNFLPPHEQTYAPRDDIYRSEKRFDSSETDLFATENPYPTPTDSQISEMVMGENTVWPETSVSEFSYNQYATQSEPMNLSTGLLAPVESLPDMTNFPFSDYTEEVPFQMDQSSLQNLDDLNFSGPSWNIAPPNPAPANLDLFASGSSSESVHIPLTKESSAKGRRRGPFRIEEKRHETGLTRKMGACIRCSMQRIRVSRESTHTERASTDRSSVFLTQPILPVAVERACRLHQLGQGFHVFVIRSLIQSS